MMIGLAPPFALIVEDAAGIERDVAADGPHIALGGAGDVTGGLGHRREMHHDGRMDGEFGKSYRGADLQHMRIGADAPQLADAVDVDQNRRRDDAAAHIHHQIGAAAEQAAVRISGPRGNKLRQSPRADQIKLRERIHQALPLVLCPRARFSSAAKTRSGVTGRSLKRRPVASAMALVSAGRNAASDPSPASLAPNGPCGSLLSTMPTSIGGESWMVGTR